MASRVCTVLSLTTDEKRQLVSVLGNVDESTREVFGLTLDESQWASVSNISGAVAYQGFDPLKVIAEFMRKSQAEISTNFQTIKVGDIPIQTCIGTDAKTDLLFLLTLFITRGNNVEKILLKCDATVKDVIARKCSQYGISTTSRNAKTPLGPSVITLARLSQAFAPATASIILGHSIQGNLKSKLFPGVVLPLIMTHTIFPALLRETDTELIEIARYLNMEMSIMLSTPKEKRRMSSMIISELLEQSDSFVMAAVNGSISAPSVKEKALKKANLIEDTGVLSLTTSAMYAMCARLNSMHNDTYSYAIRKISELSRQVSPN